MNRGYCGIGIMYPKKQPNIGGLWRAATCFGADFVFVVGSPWLTDGTDTTRAERHLPAFTFADGEDLLAHAPVGCEFVAVEIDECATPLPEFVHPERAVYILGSEVVGIDAELLSECAHIVSIPTARCLNVVQAGECVLYDRIAKQHLAARNAQEAEAAK